MLWNISLFFVLCCFVPYFVSPSDDSLYKGYDIFFIRYMYVCMGNISDAFENQQLSSLNIRLMTELVISHIDNTEAIHWRKALSVGAVAALHALFNDKFRLLQHSKISIFHQFKRASLITELSFLSENNMWLIKIHHFSDCSCFSLWALIKIRHSVMQGLRVSVKILDCSCFCVFHNYDASLLLTF